MAVRNDGRLPLRTAMARTNRAIRPLRVALEIDRDRILQGSGQELIDGLDADGQLLRTLDACLRRYENDDAKPPCSAVPSWAGPSCSAEVRTSWLRSRCGDEDAAVPGRLAPPPSPLGAHEIYKLHTFTLSSADALWLKGVRERGLLVTRTPWSDAAGPRTAQLDE